MAEQPQPAVPPPEEVEEEDLRLGPVPLQQITVAAIRNKDLEVSRRVRAALLEHLAGVCTAGQLGTHAERDEDPGEVVSVDQLLDWGGALAGTRHPLAC